MNPVYEKLSADLEHLIQTILTSQGGVMATSNCQVGAIHTLMEYLLLARSRTRDVMTACTLLQKVIIAGLIHFCYTKFCICNL